MDRKLEIAEMRIADLEFMLIDAESKITHFRDLVTKHEQLIKRYEIRLATAREIVEAAGIELSTQDDKIVHDAEKVKAMRDRLTKGGHMQLFERMNKENPMLNDAWSRYMAALRLCGFDGTNDPETN